MVEHAKVEGWTGSAPRHSKILPADIQTPSRTNVPLSRTVFSRGSRTLLQATHNKNLLVCSLKTYKP